MTKRVFRPRRISPLQGLGLLAISGAVSGLIFSVLAKLLILPLMAEPPIPLIQSQPSWIAVGIACSMLGVCIGIFSILFCGRTQARIELEGNTLMEFNRKGRMVVRSDLHDVMAIEIISLIRHDSYLVKFANTQFAIIGNGLENFDELKSEVFARTSVQPVRTNIGNLRQFVDRVNNRPNIT